MSATHHSYQRFVTPVPALRHPSEGWGRHGEGTTRTGVLPPTSRPERKQIFTRRREGAERNIIAGEQRCRIRPLRYPAGHSNQPPLPPYFPTANAPRYSGFTARSTAAVTGSVYSYCPSA